MNTVQNLNKYHRRDVMDELLKAREDLLQSDSENKTIMVYLIDRLLDLEKQVAELKQRLDKVS